MNTPCPHNKGATCPECNQDGYPPGRGMVGLKRHCPLDHREDSYNRWYPGDPRRFTAPKVTGSDNPHYDFDRPVSNLRELVDVLDPNMSYKRYNMLKSIIRWEDKPDLEYNLEKIIYHAEREMLQVQKNKEDR